MHGFGIHHAAQLAEQTHERRTLASRTIHGGLFGRLVGGIGLGIELHGL